jgi:DNA-binding NarL/FixJ family response regulator
MNPRQTIPDETTILICDDDAAMRGLLRLVVDLAPGMRTVGEAPDGEVAISEASRLQPDVILLDLAMPVLSGLDALPQLRQSAVAAKIIVLAGFSTETVADQVLALGADRYLEKGAGLETIVATIEYVVAGTATLAHSEGV